MNQEILPIFKTSASIGRSILTVEDETEINDNSPVSVIAIAQKYKLDKLVIVDDSFINFPSLYKNCKKHKIQLVYGINFTVCNDAKQKSEESLSSNCKISVLMRNSDGYKDLLKLHNAIKAKEENFYYISRADYSILKDNWSDNLSLVLPSYDNFLHKNLLEYGKCLPDFGKIKPIMTYSKMELPFDNLLIQALTNYAKNNDCDLLETHNIYYYKKSQYKDYNMLRSINNRGKFSSPNVDFLCSDLFSFESFLDKTQGKFI